ncbi:hypothetical protein MTR_3g023680 [Medicago truncatula]|uniref:Uncharacterized protein n=1 Tax=Medicago truncatula TaxID=3880 RepID=G7IWD9_MEDTR|nr:hypothetical protein MTR_3g023680 [Medicago truncatula]
MKFFQEQHFEGALEVYRAFTFAKEPLQENCHFATGKLRLCDSLNCRNRTFATVPQPTRKCMSQRYFATVRETVVTTVVKGIAAVVTVAM